MSDQDFTLLDLNSPVIEEEIVEEDKENDRCDSVLEDVLNCKTNNEDHNATNECMETGGVSSKDVTDVIADKHVSEEEEEEEEERIKPCSPQVFTLPQGWEVISKQRKKGVTKKGSVDKYWLSPDGTKYTSLIGVKRALKRVINK